MPGPLVTRQAACETSREVLSPSSQVWRRSNLRTGPRESALGWEHHIHPLRPKWEVRGSAPFRRPPNPFKPMPGMALTGQLH